MRHTTTERPATTAPAPGRDPAPCSANVAAGFAAAFARDETGYITPLAVFFVTIFLFAGGFAVDLSHHHAARTQLQAATDSVAHAALVTRRRGSVTEARSAALELLETNMPRSRYGFTIQPEDIEFGRWVQGSFEPSATGRQAVRVTGRRVDGRANALRTVLLRTVGVRSLDMTVTAAFTTFQPVCIDEGFVAEGKVDVQSNNNYLRGFCIHSNDHVRINQNNYFEQGTIVSMPDLADLDIPNSGFERNEGLEAALREAWLDIRVLREFDDIVAGLRNHDGEYARPYIDDPGVLHQNLNRNNNRMDADDFTPGRIHEYSCVGQNQRITIPNGTLLSRIVLITNCQVDMGSNVRLEDVTIASTNTTSAAISGVSIGRDDDCAPGGGAQIITYGSMRFPANMGIFGGQLIALGDVEFAARADGVQGASIIAGGVIDGTSNSTMARCNTAEDHFYGAYYRMVL